MSNFGWGNILVLPWRAVCSVSVKNCLCSIPFKLDVFSSWKDHSNFNPIALRKAKIEYNFGLSECNRVKTILGQLQELF